MKISQILANAPVLPAIGKIYRLILNLTLFFKPRNFFTFVSSVAVMASLVFAFKDPSLRFSFLGIVALWLPICQSFVGKD
jgi:hypothetical protein